MHEEISEGQKARYVVFVDDNSAWRLVSCAPESAALMSNGYIARVKIVPQQAWLRKV